MTDFEPRSPQVIDAEHLRIVLDPCAVFIVVPTELEARPLLAELRDLRSYAVAAKPLWTGWAADVSAASVGSVGPVAVMVTGYDKTNLAHGLTCLLQAARPALVILSGIAGAFSSSGLRPGDLALAEREVYADTGASSEEGWLSAEQLGLPLAAVEGKPVWNEMPVAGELVDSILEHFREAGWAVASGGFAADARGDCARVRKGCFVTQSRVSGTAQEAAELERRWSPLVETMEGAAGAHVCLLYGVPFVEIRGVSNLVGPRDRSSWQVERAAEQAARGTLAVIRWFLGAKPRPRHVPTGGPAVPRDSSSVTEVRAPEPEPLTLAFSPCPNDTYLFHAWVHKRLPGAPPVRERLEDIEALNRLAARGEVQIAKVSFHAFGHLRDRYALLHSGGALGRGCGPLLVARSGFGGSGSPEEELAGARILVPGAWTTAALLLRLFAPGHAEPVVTTYDRIMPALAAGEADVGVIIHESRFTYPAYGLRCLADLGEWWEKETGRPIPLGGIVVRRDLPEKLAAAADAAIRDSLLFARRDPEASQAYVRRHAQEMDSEVCRRHIDLYVTEFTLDYGTEGEDAVRELLARGAGAGAFPPATAPLFWDSAS